MAQSEITIANDESTAAGFASSKVYLRYVMVTLLVICTLNFLDRQIMNILAEPIKHEFRLSDRQLGMLTGFYFALFYSVLSIPLARMADRGNRSWLIAGSLAIWSLFTAACGVSKTYLQLAVFRLFVGVGEAGGSPTAQSLITDYHPRHERASAIAFYTVGIPIGSLLGLVLGGLVLDRFGWRTAFLLAGLPGLVIAVLVLLTIREPRQGHALAASPPAAPKLSVALAEILSKPSFILMTLGGSLVTFVNYGQSAFLPSFFFRNHAVGLAALAASLDARTGAHLGAAGVLGVAFGLISGVGGIVGTLGGGWLTDRQARRRLVAYVDIQVIFTLARIPLFWAGLLAPTPLVAMSLIGLQGVCMGIAGAPAYAAIQGLVQPRVRATAAAIFLLGLNLFGLGLGPLGVGALSDALAVHGYGAAVGLKLSLGALQLVLLGAAALIAFARPYFAKDTVS